MLTRDAIQGLKPLSTISVEAFREFLSALDATVPVSMSIEDDLKRFSSSTPNLQSLSDDERVALSSAIIGAHFIRSSPGMTEAEFLADIRDSAINAGYQEDAVTKLVSNVSDAISSQVLRASIKAWALSSEQERLYLSSRILTDVRPIFGDDDCNQLLASVMIHTLKITTRADGRPQSVFVALDNDDIVELRSALDRALSKAEVVSVQLKNTAFLPILGANKQT